MRDIIYDLKEPDWNSGRKITSGFPFDLTHVKYINIHYTGATNRYWINFVDFLNRTNDQYWSRRPVGYAFGYSAAVSNITGQTAEGRGLNYRAASNGDSDSKDDVDDPAALLDNKEVFSIIVDAPVGEPLSEAGKKGILRLARQLKEIKPSLYINGHKDLDHTACPGEVYHSIPELNKLLNESLNDTVMLGDLEILDQPYRLMDSRTFRADPYPANSNFVVTFKNPVKGALVMITPVGANNSGWASVWNKVTSFANWSRAHHVNPSLVPIKTKDNKFTVYTREAAHFIVDVYAEG